MAEVPFSRLVHDVAQNSYKDLHALLDSISDVPSDERRTRLLDYALRTRHRLLRLLVSVRWHMECSAFHSSARSVNQLAVARSSNFVTTADSLWSIAQLTRGAAAHASAVAYSAEILGPGISTFRLPRFIELSINVDTLARPPSKPSIEGLPSYSRGETHFDTFDPPVDTGSRMNAEESEAEMRLRLETALVIRMALPAGIEVTNWSADPSSVAVRVALRDAWQVDLVLDRIPAAEAFFRIVQFKIFVRTHVDALDPIRRSSTSEDEERPISPEQYSFLRQMLEDRMSWAAVNAGDSDAIARTKASLNCLCLMMTREICTELALEHVREQAKHLGSHPAWRKSKLIVDGIGSKAGRGIPVSIRYWNESPFCAVVSVVVPKDEVSVSSESLGMKGKCHEVVLVSHQPPLPSRKSEVEIELRAINVEAVCLESARRRAEDILGRLRESCLNQIPLPTNAVCVKSGSAMQALVFEIGHFGFGLQLSMSLRTAAFQVGLRGGPSLTFRQRLESSLRLRRALWKGERHFQNGIEELKKVLMKIISALIASLRAYTVSQQAILADEAAILVWPPGAASVETPQHESPEVKIAPPFLPIERKRPRRFLAFRSWKAVDDYSSIPKNLPPAKRRRTSPVSFVTSSDGLIFVQGKIPYGLPPQSEIGGKDIRCSAQKSAGWAKIRHTTEMRFRRDRLLRELEIRSLALANEEDFQMKSSERSSVIVKADPMPVQSAFLIFRGEDAWGVEIMLSVDVFGSDTKGESSSVCYKASSRLLSFSYTSVSSAVLVRFQTELRRARCAAAIAMGIGGKSKLVTLEQKNPFTTTVKCCGITCNIGHGAEGFQVRFPQNGKYLQTYLGPYLEEFMNASRSYLEKIVINLFERSLPLAAALEALKSPNPANMRVKMQTLLRARVVMTNPNPLRVYGFDIDTRSGRGRAILIDIARAYLLQKDKPGSGNNRGFTPMVNWPKIIESLVNKGYGKSLHEGAALMVPIALLTTVVQGTVTSTQRHSVPSQAVATAAAVAAAGATANNSVPPAMTPAQDQINS